MLKNPNLVLVSGIKTLGSGSAFRCIDVRLRGRHMTASQLVSPEKLRLAAPPHCAACGLLMRLATIEPHVRFNRLDIHSYACECGRVSEETRAREG
jgi:hypothetical protein